MSGPNYAPPLGTATPGPAANVPQSTPQPPVFNETNTITSTQQMLADVLQVASGPAGQPAANSPVTYNGTAWANAGSVRWE
jgi:hypothetical protein